MNDTRLIQAKEGLLAALVELDSDTPNIGRVRALLDDSRCDIVEVVEENLSHPASADVNQLDSARVYIGRSLELLPRWSAVPIIEQFVGHALDHIQVVLSGNVIALDSRRHPHRPGGGAA